MYEKSLKLKHSDKNSKPSTSLKKKMGLADQTGTNFNSTFVNNHTESANNSRERGIKMQPTLLRSISLTTNDQSITSEYQQNSQGSDQKDRLVEIQLNDHYFSGVSWSKAVEQLKLKNDRNILGLQVADSDLLWRYFVRQTNQHILMQQ